ncbi:MULTISPECIES: hypothetical protein [Streptomyces]|uniref:hypothetical protein n=1 Tax=Streptomyces TaxID=1883 RepID=UPI00163D00DD|nr:MULTISPECIES: hypothetical protein [Streptomyces]MBC2875103.1 hypothetical protein [Streptomyces sp. TYQ1024]UBI36940.1 hypothetical protein K7I03_11040 [Streptomyces mobaraensis]
MTRAAAPAADPVAAAPVFGGPAIPAQAGPAHPGAGSAPAVGIPAAPGRPGSAPDPVRALLLRHHAVCADAVDPWELAARLEARGVTDRAAAVCGHRDVFSLAEELYARVGGGTGDSTEDGTKAGAGAPAGVRRAGAVRAAGDSRRRPDEVEWPQFRTRDWGRYGTPDASGTEGAPALGGGVNLGSRAAGRSGASRDAHAIGASGVPGVPGFQGVSEVSGSSRGFRVSGPTGAPEAPEAAAGSRVPRASCASYDPDAYGLCPARPGRSRRTVAGALAWAWLLAYGCVGDRLLSALLHGHARLGPRALATAAAPTALGLACAVAPAAWCAHAFAGYARRRLADSRSLTAFRVRARCALPTVLTVVLGALFLSVWTARSALPGLGHPTSVPALAALALGFLLFLDRLCAAHGLARPAAAAVLAACAAEALPPVLLLAARLPGCAALGWPVTRLPGTLGPSAPGLVACAGAAVVLTVRAFAVLPHAAVHGLGGPDAAGAAFASSNHLGPAAGHPGPRAGHPGLSANQPGLSAGLRGPSDASDPSAGFRSACDAFDPMPGCADASSRHPGSSDTPSPSAGHLDASAGHPGSSDTPGPSAGHLDASSGHPGPSFDHRSRFDAPGTPPGCPGAPPSRPGPSSGHPGPSAGHPCPSYGRPDPSPGLPGPSLRPGGAGPSAHPRQRSTHHDR